MCEAKLTILSSFVVISDGTCFERPGPIRSQQDWDQDQTVIPGPDPSHGKGVGPRGREGGVMEKPAGRPRAGKG